jgi:hypothetical protein
LFGEELKIANQKNFNVVENQLKMDCFISNQRIGKVLFWLTASLGNRDWENNFSEQAQENA